MRQHIVQPLNAFRILQVGRRMRNENHHHVVTQMNALQCKLARVALGWGVRELAAAAKVSTQTISRLERGEQLRPNTVASIQIVLETAGVVFIPENSERGVGVRLAKAARGSE